MPGRRLLSDAEVIAANAGFFGDPASVRRRAVLRETIAAFESQIHLIATIVSQPPTSRAGGQSDEHLSILQVQVHADDWGEVTRHMTARYGICFAVLNMANAYVPGGAYVEGAIAQEENMFRRTDCHFHIDAVDDGGSVVMNDFSFKKRRLTPQFTSQGGTRIGRCRRRRQHRVWPRSRCSASIASLPPAAPS